MSDEEDYQEYLEYMEFAGHTSGQTTPGPSIPWAPHPSLGQSLNDALGYAGEALVDSGVGLAQGVASFPGQVYDAVSDPMETARLMRLAATEAPAETAAVGLGLIGGALGGPLLGKGVGALTGSALARGVGGMIGEGIGSGLGSSIPGLASGTASGAEAFKAVAQDTLGNLVFGGAGNAIGAGSSLVRGGLEEAGSLALGAVEQASSLDQLYAQGISNGRDALVRAPYQAGVASHDIPLHQSISDYRRGGGPDIFSGASNANEIRMRADAAMGDLGRQKAEILARAGRSTTTPQDIETLLRSQGDHSIIGVEGAAAEGVAKQFRSWARRKALLDVEQSPELRMEIDGMIDEAMEAHTPRSAQAYHHLPAEHPLRSDLVQLRNQAQEEIRDKIAELKSDAANQRLLEGYSIVDLDSARQEVGRLARFTERSGESAESSRGRVFGDSYPGVAQAEAAGIPAVDFDRYQQLNRQISQLSGFAEVAHQSENAWRQNLPLGYMRGGASLLFPGMRGGEAAFRAAKRGGVAPATAEFAKLASRLGYGVMATGDGLAQRLDDAIQLGIAAEVDPELTATSPMPRSLDALKAMKTAATIRIQEMLEAQGQQMAMQGAPTEAIQQQMDTVQSAFADMLALSPDHAVDQMRAMDEMLPGFFETSPWKSLWNDRITDPQEQASYRLQLIREKNSGRLSLADYSKRLSKFNNGGSVR